MTLQIDQATLQQKRQTAVNRLTTQAFVVSIALGGFLICFSLIMLLFSPSLVITLFALPILGLGLLIGGVGSLRAWQMRTWDIVVVQAKVLEKRKVTFRGTRHYLRLQILQAEKIDTSGLSPLGQSLSSEVEYMVNLQVFNQLQEGETAQFICVPKSKQILDLV